MRSSAREQVAEDGPTFQASKMVEDVSVGVKSQTSMTLSVTKDGKHSAERRDLKKSKWLHENIDERNPPYPESALRTAASPLSKLLSAFALPTQGDQQ